MTHKKIEIDLYIGTDEDQDLEALKKEISKILKESLKEKNISFEINDKNADLEDLEKKLKSPMYPIPKCPEWPKFPEWPTYPPVNPCNPAIPTGPGDTPDSIRWQPMSNSNLNWPYKGL